MVLKVGDKVTIKSWEEMEKEFGLKMNGNIDVQWTFAKEMKDLCEQSFEITSIGGQGTHIRLGGQNWSFSPLMFKKKGKEKPVINTITLPESSGAWF